MIPPQQAVATPLGRVLGPMLAAHAGESAVHIVDDPEQAFVSRVLAARAARRSLDIQTYLWHDDTTGTLLFKVARDAAARGVRVRILIDDRATAGMDPVLSELDARPNIQIRLFNPVFSRHLRWWGYVTGFSRFDRRMHNKALIVDDRLALFGGRNIGDEYFGAPAHIHFSDLDVMAIGPVVAAMNRDFDRYWNSRAAYPVAQLVKSAPPEGVLDGALERVRESAAGRRFLQLTEAHGLVERIRTGRVGWHWAPMTLVSDPPGKVLGDSDREHWVVSKLKRRLPAPHQRLDLVSPYFLPKRAGVERLQALARRGVSVRILTNSLEASDAKVVYGAYAKWRDNLLKSGIRLYEMKGDRDRGLHTKALFMDRRYWVVGSFNLDPRSVHLNTESCLIINSPALARLGHRAFRSLVPEDAYRVRLAGDGHLYWREHSRGRVIRHDTEPGTTLWQRLVVKAMALPPVEWLL